MTGSHGRQDPGGTEREPWSRHSFRRPADFPAILQSHTS
jgi:hypothetical protein